jgi:HK97 family phage major capsid protein
MSQLTELRERQARIVSEARERLEQINSATDDARATELRTQHDTAMAEFDRLQAQVEREVAFEERARIVGEVDTSRRPNRDDRSSSEDRSGDQQPDERALFSRAMQYGVEELSQDERRSLAGLRANLTPEQRAQSVGTTTAGGFTVPQGFLPEIAKTLALWGPMLDSGLCRILTTDTGAALPWVTVNDTANTGEDHAENAAATDQDVTFGQRQLDAYLYDSGIVKVSFELLQDSAFEMQSLLDDLFGDRLGRRANAKLTTGTGTSQPNGIVTGSGLGVTAASATAIAADELFDVFHSVDPAYRGSPKCAWQFNDSFLKTVRKLKDGQGNYLWAMGDVKNGTPPTLLDKPYFLNQAMANIATGNRVAIFGDMSKYTVRMVKQMQMMRLNERFADQLQVGFMAWMRVDGEYSDAAAIKHYKMA